jgi:hypothetical protein
MQVPFPDPSVLVGGKANSYHAFLTYSTVMSMLAYTSSCPKRSSNSFTTAVVHVVSYFASYSFPT